MLITTSYCWQWLRICLCACAFACFTAAFASPVTKSKQPVQQTATTPDELAAQTSAVQQPLGAAEVPGLSADLAATMARCAPTVHPETMAAIVSAESRGHQFAIADAGPVRLPWSERKKLVRSLYPGNLQDAVAIARKLIAAGHTVSLGVGQVNDRNLPRLGLSIADAFDVCTNLSAAGRILTDFYVRAVKQFGEGDKALHAALSAYNSGDWVRGARDGYVDLVYRQIGRPLAVRTDGRSTPLLTKSAQTPAGAAPAPDRTFTMTASDYSSHAQ